MEAILWVLMPVLVAAGAALLAFFVMQARMEVALANEREVLVEVRTKLEAQTKSIEDIVRRTEEESKRKALDDFLGELRVEERHYVREKKSLLGSRRNMVLQERIYFRNIPLSGWVEHEMTIEEGTNMQDLKKTASLFGTQLLRASGPPQALPIPARKALR